MGCLPSTWRSELGRASVPRYPFECSHFTKGLTYSVPPAHLVLDASESIPLQHMVQPPDLCHSGGVIVLPLFDLPG